MELKKSSKEKEVYSYTNNKGEKLWMYRHKYYDGASGKRKEKKKSGFKTEKAAIQALIEVKAQTLRGNTSIIENDNLTVAQWLDVWYESNTTKWRSRTKKIRASAIKIQINPLIGHYKIQKLNKATYQKQFIDKLAESYAPSTVKSIHEILKNAVNAAVEEEILVRNPFTRVALPEDNKKKSEMNFLTPEQLAILIDTAKRTENITNYTLLLLIAYTGVRRSESVGLKWADINFETNKISILRIRSDEGLGKVKTANSLRTILVDHLVIKQLQQYKLWCKKKSLSLGRSFSEDDLIFIRACGEPVNPGFPYSMVKRVMAKAKLPDVTVHGLRHTHATILMNQKMPVRVIAERLGNTPQMIHNVYGHLLKELEEESVSVFSRSLEAFGAKSGANN